MNKIAKFFRDSMSARFFIPGGLVLIIFAIAVFIINNKNSNFIETEATVTKIELASEEHYEGEEKVEATYTVYVVYTVDGKEYNNDIGDYFEDKYKVGDKVSVHYNPSDPSQISEPTGIWLPIVFLVVGVGFIAYGVYDTVRIVKKNKKMKEQEKEWKNGK